jgi:hypothetical protein
LFCIYEKIAKISRSGDFATSLSKKRCYFAENIDKRFWIFFLNLSAETQNLEPSNPKSSSKIHYKPC